MYPAGYKYMPKKRMISIMPHVDIPDPNLRAAIENALGKVGGESINVNEMAILKELDLRESGVRCLTGLEDAKNLSHLSAGGNLVSDLSPLKELTNLKSLDFWGNTMSDLSTSGRINQSEGIMVSEQPDRGFFTFEGFNQPRISES